MQGKIGRRGVEILMCVEIWKKIFSDYKRFLQNARKKNDKRFLACRFNVQLPYALIIFSTILFGQSLRSIIFSRLSFNQLFAQLVVQKYSRITQKIQE